MKSYVFAVKVEPDADAWRAYVPALEAKGAATWGQTRQEAIQNMHEVLEMVLEDLLEAGEALPVGVTVTDEPVVAVTL
ncbi:type II toxin-antitoxin system HicB family antitoxin [Candidatus Binatia bacterium]|nr:type II toxin-antitoxin system HicB family antitoxin [Candidatus Binatia bacterium]